MEIFNKHKRKTGNQGFSLLEVLVAIVILALVIAPILQSFISTAKINSNSRSVLNATDVGDVVMEELTGMSFKTITDKLTDTTQNVTAIPGFTQQPMSATSIATPNMDSFVAWMKLKYGIDGTQRIVFYKWTVDSKDCTAISLHGVEYEKKTFDVVFCMTPSKGIESGDNYYTYDIEMRVYGVKKHRHYDAQYVTIYGAVPNMK